MPPRTLAVHALDDPKFKPDPAKVALGGGLYIMCSACHGLNLISSGAPAPDLRESDIALNPDEFYKVVHDGILIQAGMPRFDFLSHDQVMAIYSYIRAGARQTLAAQSGNPATTPPVNPAATQSATGTAIKP
jgi:quinohemoprotein ethanol dehydrogenase